VDVLKNAASAALSERNFSDATALADCNLATANEIQRENREGGGYDRIDASIFDITDNILEGCVLCV